MRDKSATFAENRGRDLDRLLIALAVDAIMRRGFRRVRPGARQMNIRVLFAIAAVIGAIPIAAPAVADEAPPVRHARAAPRQAAPARAAPTQTAQSNWTGSQVGGQGGVNSMAQGFAEPGAH